LCVRQNWSYAFFSALVIVVFVLMYWFSLVLGPQSGSYVSAAMLLN
jgi:hypothetical protein